MAVDYSVKKIQHKNYKNVVPIRSSIVVEEVERRMENISPDGWFSPFKDDLPMLSDELLHVDLIDRDDEVIIKVEMPDIKKDDLEVTLTDHSVTIRGCIRSEHEQGEGEYYRHEVVARTFRRTDTLPAIVDDLDVRAVLKNGVLKISAPKMDRTLQHHIIID